ncbi:NIPSNAP family protein, partial [Fulvivirgaceae bacterium PWU20]|nr:NIPSNAP family protein [Chryseosolibacter indicus]
LTYMITFENMEERDKNWKAFGQDPDWQRMSKAPEFANSVSKIYKTFLEPLPYSQV